GLWRGGEAWARFCARPNTQVGTRASHPAINPAVNSLVAIGIRDSYGRQRTDLVAMQNIQQSNGAEAAEEIQQTVCPRCAASRHKHLVHFVYDRIQQNQA